MRDLQNVSLATAAGVGEEEAYDKLSNLCAVGSGFGSLIYKLPNHAGYCETSAGCMTLWEALKNNPKLNTILVCKQRMISQAKHIFMALPVSLQEDCSKELEWYNGVWETSVTVKSSSYYQMENILAYGQYCVGVAMDETVRSIYDIVRLKLDVRHKPLPKTSYSLDNLRELESKLVLIKGNRAEYRIRVDQFLNVSNRRHP